jgi:uncharacterized protein YndB with AHSA1/START domain
VAVTSSGTAVVTLPADDQILIKREFAAPKHLVYRAWTSPELVKRWWSSDYGEMSVADIDLRVGGRWRYAMVTKDGLDVAFHGEYREIVPNERIVSTEVYEAPAEGGADTAAAEEQAAVNTVTFTEVDGATTLTVLVQCPTNDVRDAIIDSGMEVGMQKAYDFLEQVAVSLM